MDATGIAPYHPGSMARRAKALAGAAVFASAALVGCPRDVNITITGEGLRSILNSCVGGSGAPCAGPQGDVGDVYIGDPGPCLTSATHLQILLAPREGGEKPSLSACVPVVPGGDDQVCNDDILAALNDAIQISLASGLEGPDVDSVADGLILMLAFTEDGCDPLSMAVCARLDRVDDDSLDVVCAECGGQPTDATRACDRKEQACFLERCFELAKAAQ